MLILHSSHSLQSVKCWLTQTPIGKLDFPCVFNTLQPRLTTREGWISFVDALLKTDAEYTRYSIMIELVMCIIVRVYLNTDWDVMWMLGENSDPQKQESTLFEYLLSSTPICWTFNVICRLIHNACHMIWSPIMMLIRAETQSPGVYTHSQFACSRAAHQFHFMWCLYVCGKKT